MLNRSQKKPTLKIPPLHASEQARALSEQARAFKSMAPPAPRECNQPARSALHRIPCSAAHYIASRTAQRTARMQPARAQRIESQTALSSAHWVLNFGRGKRERGVRMRKYKRKGKGRGIAGGREGRSTEGENEGRVSSLLREDTKNTGRQCGATQSCK